MQISATLRIAPTIANWLSGYFNELKNNSVVDFEQQRQGRGLLPYEDVTLIEAAKKALPLPK
jgi:hypothetical protein